MIKQPTIAQGEGAQLALREMKLANALGKAQCGRKNEGLRK
jgi:hypothetical protein